MITSRTLLFPLLLIASTAAAQPNTWVRSGNLNGPARHDALGFSIGDKVYTCLGLNMEGDTLTDLWEYDPALETWTEKAGFPGVARVGAVAFAIGNKAYVGTGAAANDTLNDLWAYDPTTDTWSQKADLPGVARVRAVALSVGALGYVLSGVGPAAYQDEEGNYYYPTLGDLWAYAPASDSWTQRADLFTAFVTSNEPGAWSGFALGGQAYFVALGMVGPDYYEGLWAYEPLSDSWTQKAVIGEDLIGFFSLYSSIGFALGNHGYLIDMGFNPEPVFQTYPNKLLRYDAVADTWTLLGYFPGVARDGATCSVVGTVAHLSGGTHIYPVYFNPDPDGDPPMFTNYPLDVPEVWSYDIRDCQGIPEGTNVPGTACNDNNAATYGDVFGPLCVCSGSAQYVAPFHPDEVDADFSTGAGFNGEVQALALQPDGKVLAAGAFTAFNGTPCGGIARLNSDGSLDNTFIGAFGGRALALQPDGRILVGGNGIHRLMPDGSNDPTYDTYLTALADQTVAVLALRPDGRILAGGSFDNDDGSGGIYWQGLVQLLPDGSFDPAFYSQYYVNVLSLALRPDGTCVIGWGQSGNGYVNITLLGPAGDESYPWEVGLGANEPVRALALRPNGEVVIGGDFSMFDDDMWFNDGSRRDRIAMVNGNGELSTTFDPGTAFDDKVHALAIGPQGQIIAGGDFSTYRYAPNNGIALINDYGYADPLFNSGTGFNGGVRCFALAPDGSLLVGGLFTSYNGTTSGHITRLRTPGPICIPTQLTTTSNPVVSCGAVNLKLNGTSTIAATEVPGANKYQFRFTNIPGQPAYARNIAFPTRSFTLTKWATNPLKAGRTYNVMVRSSFDNGATWCDDGPSCTVRMSWTHLAPGMERDMEETALYIPELLVYPNPTNGEQLRINLSGADPELATATLELTDLFGKRVMTAMLPLRDGEINQGLSLSSDLSAGMYLMTIIAGDEVFNERLMISR